MQSVCLKCGAGIASAWKNCYIPPLWWLRTIHRTFSNCKVCCKVWSPVCKTFFIKHAKNASQCGAWILSAWNCAPSGEFACNWKVMPLYVIAKHTFSKNVRSVFWSVEPGLENIHISKSRQNVFWSKEPGFYPHETVLQVWSWLPVNYAQLRYAPICDNLTAKHNI